MKDLENYSMILNLCFNKPPKTVPEYIQKYIMTKYPVDIINYKNIAYCIVVKVNEGVYGIGWVAVHPTMQFKGYGKKLFEKVHKKYKGIFITKAIKKSVGFYKKLGYKSVYSDDKHSILVYVNSKGAIKW